MSLEFSADAQKKIQALCERYQVSGSKKPVVMAALHLAQKEHGHLSDDAWRIMKEYDHETFISIVGERLRRHSGR